MTNIDKPGTDAEEGDSVLLVLCVELGVNHIHRRLASAVDTGQVDLVVVDPVHVAHATRDADDLLDLALEDLGHEDVVEVDVGEDVDVEDLPKLGVKLFTLLCSNFCKIIRSVRFNHHLCRLQC